MDAYNIDPFTRLVKRIDKKIEKIEVEISSNPLADDWKSLPLEPGKPLPERIRVNVPPFKEPCWRLILYVVKGTLEPGKPVWLRFRSKFFLCIGGTDGCIPEIIGNRVIVTYSRKTVSFSPGAARALQEKRGSPYKDRPSQPMRIVRRPFRNYYAI